ncbi:hypothetical protein GGR54DRAFT_327354 [Hypoxylon sp. NC1633]|nr:hypothetical protein GGR54DRAFT_327354 [Hypoxylon sp. NC1633]
MDNLAQLEYHASALVTAVQDLVRNVRSNVLQANATDWSMFDPQNSDEVNRARRSVLSHAAGIRTLVCGPTDFLEHLASQSEMLACLRWLGNNQILACIPQTGTVPVKDLADLANVSETQLCRVIRLTATGGFLREDARGHVGHTALSDPFFNNPLLLDAVMFMAESAAPAALKMATTDADTDTAKGKNTDQSAYNMALNTSTPFCVACEEQPRLNRQYSAYLQYAAGLHVRDNFADTLAQLNWSNISNACIVEVGAQSTSTARRLASLYPPLRFVVQIVDPAPTPQLKPRLKIGRTASPEPQADLNPRITVAIRTLGAKQTTTDGGVYILHIPSCSPNATLSELQLHCGILRANSSIMLIPTAHLLPEPGSLVDSESEAVARSRDLGLMQLANEREMELSELLEMIESVKDDAGRLVVVRRLHSSTNLVVALVVKYQMDSVNKDVQMV